MFERIPVAAGSYVTAPTPLETLDTPSLYWDVEAPGDGYVHGLYVPGGRSGQAVADGLALAAVATPLFRRAQHRRHP